MTFLDLLKSSTPVFNKATFKIDSPKTVGRKATSRGGRDAWPPRLCSAISGTQRLGSENNSIQSSSSLSHKFFTSNKTILPVFPLFLLITSCSCEGIAEWIIYKIPLRPGRSRELAGLFSSRLSMTLINLEFPRFSRVPCEIRRFDFPMRPVYGTPSLLGVGLH
jgi:hypothetical protein